MQRSESIKNLAAALVKFQAEVKNPANTANNPFFKSKYAPLPDILNDVRPLLTKHGLAVLQSPSGDGDKIVITTMLIHESGEWIETCPLILKADKGTAQGAGSAITYGRRYALAAVLGISSEDDDDGNHATGNDNKTTDIQKARNAKNSGNKPKQDTQQEKPNWPAFWANMKAMNFSKEDVHDIASSLTKKEITSISDWPKVSVDKLEGEIKKIHEANQKTAAQG